LDLPSNKRQMTYLQKLFQDHMSIAIAITTIIALIIIVVPLTLGLYFGLKPPSPGTSNKFHGPSNVNGDAPASSSTLYGNPQYLLNPSGYPYPHFATQMWTHQAGYICAILSGGPSSAPFALAFYYTNLKGALQESQIIPLDFLPAGYVPVNGSFAPIFNYVNEIYYFFLSVGFSGCCENINPDQTCLSACVDNNVYCGCNEIEIDYFATNVIVFSLNTATSSTTWTPQSLQHAYTTTFSNPSGSVKITGLSIPVQDFTWSTVTPWIGTFGNTIQVVMNDNSSVLKQSLYVSGSQYSHVFPGGSLYWYDLANNDINPTVDLVDQIQDTKLALLAQAAENGTLSCSTQPPVLTVGTYLNSFGANFFVTSGNGANNVLIISNVTGEDYCNLNDGQPAAPNGYVQGFTFDTKAYAWVQPTTPYGNTDIFEYRYIPVGLGKNYEQPGFGYGLGFFNNVLTVGLSFSVTGVAKYLAFAWTALPNAADPKNPGNLVIQGIVDSSPPIGQTPLFPTPGAFNVQKRIYMMNLNDAESILFSTWDYQVKDVISIQQPFESGTSPFTKSVTLQTLGSTYSSQNSSDTATSFIGFGQSIGSWVSRTGISVRLAFNDPDYNNRQGRCIILVKARSA